MANPSPKLLDDVEVATVKELFFPLLKDDQPTRFSNNLERTRRIYDGCMALDWRDMQLLTPSNSKKVTLIRTLDDFTWGDIDLGSFYWTNPSVETIIDVAKSYNLTINGDWRNLPYFQAKIWGDQPNAVFYSLFANNIITISDSNVRNGCLQVCTVAMNSSSFRLDKDSLNTVLFDSSYQNARNIGGAPMNDIFTRLSRFVPIARFAHDVAYLLNSGYSSASQIANASKSKFLTTMSNLGMEDDSATAIYDYCLTLEVRNEQVWTAMLASRSNWTPAAIASSTSKLTTTQAPTVPLDSNIKRVITYANMFGDINVNVCEDCSSVTGPAAYFVDLLRFLKNSLSDPQTQGSSTLLDKLFTRRPDLKGLELSCSNVNTQLPYIDIVNEIMESFIQNLTSATDSGTVTIQAFNVDNKDKSESLVTQPSATNYTIYRNQIATQVFPLNLFPYNQAIDTMRTHFEAFGSSRFEVMSTFGSKYRLRANTSSTGFTTYVEAEKVLECALASEYLGLQPADFVAVTGNSIFCLDFFRLTGEASLTTQAYNERVEYLDAAQYWGYSSTGGQTGIANMLSETDGLSLITSQLLPRATMTLEDLLQILKSRFLCGRLAIETRGNTAVFNGDISDLRLRHPFANRSSSTIDPLTEEDCLVLQSLLRLWRKTSFSFQELDLALGYFTDPVGSTATSMYPCITSTTIVALAALRQVMNLTGLTVEAIMPFYGVMDTYGDASLYVKLFLQGRSAQQNSIYGKSESGRYLDGGGRTLSDNRDSILATLHIQDEHWNAILLAGNITDDVLNLLNLSMIYRISTFCKTLEINPLQYKAFISLFGRGYNPFVSPQKTLRLLKDWRACTSAGFDVDQVLHITARDELLGISNLAYRIPTQQLVTLSSMILVGLLAMDKTVPPVDTITAATATVGEMTRISTLMFDPVTAAKVKDFIEAPTNVQATIYQNLLLQIFTRNETEAQDKLFNRPQPSGTPEEITLALETQAIDRRILLLRAVTPVLRSRLMNDLILEVIKPLFSEIDPLLVRFLLSEVICTGNPRKPALDVLGNILTVNDGALRASSIQVYYTPATTDSYRFRVPNPGFSSPPEIEIDGVALMFEEINQGWVSNELNLVNGQVYLLTRKDGNLSDCTCSTRRTPSVPLDSSVLISQQTTYSVYGILLSTLRAANLISRVKLDLLEIKHMQQSPATDPLCINFGSISYGKIRSICDYVSLRNRIGSSSMTVIEFLKWTNLPNRDINLGEKLSNVTSIPQLQVQEYLDAKYVGLLVDDRTEAFRDVREIEILMDAWILMSNLTIPGLTFSSLFKWAAPTLPTTPKAATAIEFDNAANLRALTRPLLNSDEEHSALRNANNTLRENQRRVLVSYILRQEYMRTKLVFNESDLFDFFLIDVQMGPSLQTSRIKQAISTIQVFVQRCILGLEKSQGISSGTINLDRWAWMQKYRVWEASRKLFLYPENWLDPTLREDKSEAFRTLEDSILQTNLSQTTLNDQIKNYIYATAEVADLDPQAYVWDKVGVYSGTFHMFARTRHTPYSYYYRSLEISTDASPKMFWQPWSKVDAEIPSIEADGDGKVLPTPGSYVVPALLGRRLLLFLPQIVAKQVSDSTSGTSTKTFQQIGNESARANIPKKYWEIQMGWVEYRNGRWSPKQMSPATLSVVGAQKSDLQMGGQTAPADDIWAEAQKFPSVSSFKFSIASRPVSVAGVPTSVLMIDVERWVGPIGSQSYCYTYPVGRFELRGQKLVLGDPKLSNYPQRLPFSFTIPTTFGKQMWSIPPSGNPMLPSNQHKIRGSNFLPTYGYIYDLTGARDQKWTMCYDESRNDKLTGYLQDVTTTDSITSYFSYPSVNAYELTATTYDVLQNGLIPQLLESSTTYNDLDEVYKVLSNIPDSLASPTFGKRNGPWHELSTPNALYNWELGVHVIMLLMERLQATQQFDLALNVARFVFDPTIDGSAINRCWRFLPFKDIAKDPIDTAEAILRRLSPSSGKEASMQVSILEWRKNPFVAHAIARGRPSAYMKRIVMKYIEILIASGDDYFRQNTLETVPFAIQRYIEASQVYGSAPRPIPNLAKSKPATFADLELTLNDFSNSGFDMELDFPYYSDPSKRGGFGLTAPYPLTGILKSTYFCIPTNPKLLELGALIDDRLFKIRNSQDINGLSRSLSLFEPPLDPGVLAQAVARGVTLTSLLNDTVGPMPNFRFTALIEKALDMCAELKNVGASFLSVREAKDAEGLAALQSRQEKFMQNMVMDMKILAREEIDRSIAELEETRKGQVSRLEFFLALTGDEAKGVPGQNTEWDDIVQEIEKPTTDDLRLTSNEKAEMINSESAYRLSSNALSLDMMATTIRAVPDISLAAEPLGVGTQVGAITVNISDALAMGAGVMRSVAQNYLDAGARAARKADLIKQLQERRMEANAAGRDIKVTDRQIETMRTRLAICEEDIKQQRRLIDHATEVSEYLKSKYTNENLYAWMDGQVRGLFYQTYLLANELAKKAQKVYRFERSTDTSDYLSSAYWDTSRDGLFSGENLYLSLKRMEAAYLERRGHDYEITKVVSLRSIQPLALFQLRETGTAEFSIPEVLFDFDFPGHYFRRIKTLSVSIESTTNLTSGFNTTLTLLEHKYRVKAQASSGQNYLFKTTEDDDRFRTDQVPISSIAVSQSSQDSGVFEYELEFNDYQRYVPFEGAGAISKWRMELPMPIKQFDYSTIDNVVIQLQYTANAGGAAFRKAASDAAKTFQTSVTGLSATNGLFVVVDLKKDFPTQWAQLTSTARSATLSNLQNCLPFFAKDRTVKVDTISALIQSTTSATWSSNLSLTGTSSVTWTNAPDIGRCKTIRATNLSERFTSWTVSLTAAGVSAGPQSIIFVVRYYLV